MKRIFTYLFVILLLSAGSLLVVPLGGGSEKRGEYLLPGNVKEGWKVFTTKGCGSCHAIWGEGGRGGPDLGTLPEFYTSQSQLAALMWNHGPEMWARMAAQNISFQKISKKEMSDLFAFLYFIRYMDEPGDPQKGKRLIETKACIKCHTIKEGKREDLIRWGMHVNPILWAQIMWNHAPQMEKEMKRLGISIPGFKGNEMIDLIAYIRSLSSDVEKVYLSPGDPQSGEKLFTVKGCAQCHSPHGTLDLMKKKDFPKTLAQLAGTMWNHSHIMAKGMEKRGIKRPTLFSGEMADLIAFLFSMRYFDDPGDPLQGRLAFTKKQCHSCHTKGKSPDLAILKGRISPISMAQTMWNHGPEMLERMRKTKLPWQKINGKEMADLMEYLYRGMP